MSYTITYNEEATKFEMNGILENFLGTHLEVIGKKEKVSEVDTAISEGHMLSILQSHGVEVNLLEEDGSRMEW